MNKPIHIISLGAGVQSSTMALMAAKGEITPMPTAAVFADTQAEPESVYRWLGWLTRNLPFPVIVVTKGNLTKTALELRNHRTRDGQWTKSLIPVFTLEPNGKRGHMQRVCTYDYKMLEIIKAQRRIGGIKRGQKTVGVVGWIGISVDEADRIKPSRVPWVVNRWPLVDIGMTRADCLNWMLKNGYPKPPRSACVYCPYHSDAEWLRLKTEEPEEFKKAAMFEVDLQLAKSKTDNMRGVPYLHASRIPLTEVNFKNGNNEKQFTNECEGMCGV